MRNVLKIIFFSFVIFFIACEKKADAEFTTDKAVYSAGDTVRLTNTSTSGSTFMWTMPGGQIQNSKDAKYAIEANSGFDELTFSLSVKSKGHCKRSLNDKAVKVIPASWYLNQNIPYNLSSKYILSLVSIQSNTNNFIFSAYHGHGIGAEGTFYTLSIYFAAGSIPPSGTYILQSSTNNLTAYKALINVYGGALDSPSNTNFVTGQVQVEYIAGTMHVFFTDVTTNPVYYNLSGSIYYYM